jgi:predicted ester cyclase
MEHNQAIIERLYSEAVNKQISSNTGGKGASFTQYTVSAKPNSLQAFNAFFEAVRQALPDFTFTIDSVIVKGDRVMTRYSISGTHKGDFLGMAPTNDKLTITGIDIFHLDKGKVIQHWDAAHQISASTRTNLDAAASTGRTRVLRSHKAVQV